MDSKEIYKSSLNQTSKILSEEKASNYLFCPNASEPEMTSNSSSSIELWRKR